MDCCGSSKPEENEHTHAGGGAKDMWMHLIIMLIAMAAIWYFTRG